MTEELTEFEKKWGKVCPKCKKRKGAIYTPGVNLPNLDGSCQCDEK